MVRTAPSQAGQRPGSAGGAQGPTRLAGLVQGHPSAWRSGPASRYLGTACRREHGPCSSGGERQASRSCPPPTSGARLLPRDAAFAALEHRPGQRGTCPRPSAASRSGAASPRLARAEIHFLEAQEAARRGTRLAALPRQMCARGCFNHACSRYRPPQPFGAAAPGAEAARTSRRVQLAPAQHPALCRRRRGRSQPRGHRGQHGPTDLQPLTAGHVHGSQGAGLGLPRSPPRLAAGHKGQPGQGQNVLRAGAGQRGGDARRAAGLCPSRRAGSAPALLPPLGSSRPCGVPGSGGPCSARTTTPGRPRGAAGGAVGGGDSRDLLGVVVSAPDGAVWPLPGAAAARGAAGNCRRWRRRLRAGEAAPR